MIYHWNEEGEWVPLSVTIKKLPECIKDYIMWLETNADPAGTLQENYRLHQDNAALRAKLGLDGEVPPS